MNNGRRHSLEKKKSAVLLRKKGLSHREIAKELEIGVSTAFLWTKGINLTLKQKKNLIKRANKTYLIRDRERIIRVGLQNLSKYRSIPTNQELINRIVRFYKEHKRIPLKRGFNNTYIEYVKRFGSWNNAIRLAGFEPNPVLFSKKFKAADGHVCDSFAEKIIDDWFFKKNIPHNRNVPYIRSKMTADFGINNIRIEYFGLSGEIKDYDNNIQRKRAICRQNNLRLIEIYPRDLFQRDYRIYLQKLVSNIENFISK